MAVLYVQETMALADPTAVLQATDVIGQIMESYPKPKKTLLVIMRCVACIFTPVTKLPTVLRPC